MRGARGWWGAREQKCVVDRVSFSIARGETLGLVGESGSGKSTVARMILGLIPPSSGTVSFDGQEVICGASSARLRTLRRRMQPVFQDPFAALNPRMTVAQIIAEPFRIHRHDGRKARPRIRGSCWPRSAWTSRPCPAILMSFPAASGSGSTSPGRSPFAPNCSCSMSRSPPSTSASGPRS